MKTQQLRLRKKTLFVFKAANQVNNGRPSDPTVTTTTTTSVLTVSR